MDVIDSTASDPASLPARAGLRSGQLPNRARQRRRVLLRGVRQGLLALVVAGATVGTVLALRPRPVPVDVARATRGPLSVVVQESGVTRVHQKSAGLVQAGAPLLELGDPAALEVVVDLLTTDAVNVQPGTLVEIEGWGRERALAGCVRRVEPSAFTRLSALGVDEQRVNVVIALTSPRAEWTSLGDGYKVEVRIVLWQHDDVLKVPHGALFRHGRSWAVFRISDGVARRVQVVAGQRGEAEAEIVAGLSPGDEVVVHPGDRVKDGARVEIR